MLAHSSIRQLVTETPKAQPIAEALFVAELGSHERQRFVHACMRATVRAVVVDDVAACRALLEEGGVHPSTVFLDPLLDGAEELVGWLRGDPRWMGLTLVALAEHPTEGAYVRAHSFGVDDVVLRSDPGTMTRRLAAIGECEGIPTIKPWRGRAWIAHSSQHRRLVLGRVLRHAGYEVGFASNGRELLEAAAGDRKAEVVIVAEALSEELGAGWVEQVRDAVGKNDLKAVLLRGASGTDHEGETVGRLGTVEDDSAADNLLFVVNELGANLTGELRASPRLLFSTLCAFRREHEITPSFGLTYNVSRGGLYVRTLDPPTMGTPVWLELRPPGATAIVHLRGEVAWARRPSTTSGGIVPPGFGVRIIEEQCPPGDLARYRECYMAFLESPRPYSVEQPVAPADSEDGAGVEAPRTRGRILVADDEERLLRLYRRILEGAGYDVTTARDGQEALACFSRERFDAVVTDIEMPRPTGLELLQKIRQKNEAVPVIISTGAPSTESAITAVEHGAFRYVTKPFDPKELSEVVHRAVKVGRLAALKREALALHAADAAGSVDKDDTREAFESAVEQLYLVYQPIVSWQSQSVYGYEVLVRSHESRMPHPGALFGAAEELGELKTLGRAIRQVAPEPMNGRAEHLFVNLHPGDLLDDALFENDSPLARIASQVTLEITERASLHEIPGIKQRIGRLREMGFSIAVDDIGAGYAGLTSFAQLEPDVAKLDMTLVRDVDQDPTKQRLIRSFCELCSDLGIRLIAEGVETAKERDTLVELGCDLFQGYFFAKPGLPFPEPSF